MPTSDPPFPSGKPPVPGSKMRTSRPLQSHSLSGLKECMFRDSEQHEDDRREQPDTEHGAEVSRAMSRAKQGSTLLMQAMRTGRMALLNESILALRDAADRLPRDFSSAPSVFNDLGVAYVTRFDSHKEPDDLEHAIAHLRLANDLTPSEDPSRAARLSHLGNALRTRFLRSRSSDDLDEAVSLGQHAVDLVSDEHPDRIACLDSLGNALKTRYDFFRRPEDLDRAIVLKQQVVDLMPDEHPARLYQLGSLSSVLQARLDRLGTLDDLERIISLQRRVVDLAPDEHPEKPNYLNNLGAIMQRRFERLGELEALDEAISLKRRAVELTPDERPGKPARLSNLAGATLRRFDVRGDLGDLERAISLQCHAVGLVPDGHPSKPPLLGNLAASLQRRFSRLDDLSDLQQAISSARQAVNLTPDDHPSKPQRLNNLGIVIGLRFVRLGDIRDLNEAIVLDDRASTLIPDGHPDKPACLSNLADDLEIRFHRLGQLADLERAVSLQRRAADLAPDKHTDKPGWLYNLGTALRTRFDRLGEREDLGQAIALMRRAIELLPDKHPSKPGWLSNLGAALQARFQRARKLVDTVLDVEQVISRKNKGRRDASFATSRPVDVPNQANSLEHSKQTQLGRREELEDLEEAISLGRQAIDLTPDGHPDMPQRLNSLCSTLSSRFQSLGSLDDLNEAISMRRRAVNLTANEHRIKPSLLMNLGIDLYLRFNKGKELRDIEEAISLMRHAVDTTPDEHPNKPEQLNLLGFAMLAHFVLTNEPASRAGTLSCFNKALASEFGSPWHRLQASRHLVSFYWLESELTESRAIPPPYHELTSIYECAFALIPQVVWLGSSVTRRYEILTGIRQITSGAVAAAIATGGFTRAVEWLEQGRGVVWGQLHQLRDPVDDLQQQHPSLAQRLQDISRELEVSANVANTAVLSERLKHILQDESAARIQLAREYQDTLASIRQLAGFETFLMPKSFTELARVCASGPVVLINVHTSTCDALVCISANRIIHVPLPELTWEIAEKLLTQFNSSLYSSGIRRREAYDTGLDSASSRTETNSFQREILRGPAPAEDDRPLADVLFVLWIYVVQPVLRALGRELHSIGAVGALPHITWCPTGPLAPLPIHAAGEYGIFGNSNRGPKVFDYVVSSYTPTLTALLQRPARSPESPSSDFTKILVISQPDTPGHPFLPATAQEVAMLKKHFLDGDVVCLDHVEATIDAVLGAMDEYQCPYIHFACHGMQNADDPRKSAFALYDGNLELRQLMSKSTNQATLAFLSACQTATGDSELTEESVHLAAGMLAVGYQGVVGTLWSIADRDAPVVADVFYRVLKEKQARAAKGEISESQVHAAYALHEATQFLRESKDVGESNVLRWAPFVHFGL